MSKEGVKELLGAIDSSYDKLNEDRREKVGSTVPSAKRIVYQRGINKLSEAYKTYKRGREEKKKKASPSLFTGTLNSSTPDLKPIMKNKNAPLFTGISQSAGMRKKSRKNYKGGQSNRPLNKTMKRTFNIIRNYSN